MKLYAEKPPYLTTLASVVGGSITLLSKDWILLHFQALAARILIFSSPVPVALVVFYLGNLVLILLSRPQELRDRMTGRWTSFLQTGRAPDPLGRAEDFVDRAAVLAVWAKSKLLGIGEAKADHQGLPGSLVDAKMTAENAQLKMMIAGLQANGLGDVAGQLESIWTKHRGVSRLPDLVFFEDPIYGQVQLDRRVYPIFYHPLFQRLNYIRQLSFAYLIFPSASHNRLSHILGVMRNAKVAMEGIFERGVVYRWNSGRPQRIPLSHEERNRLCLKAQVCALLHDVGHGPFGHALDKLIPYLDGGGKVDVPDKIFSIKYVGEIFANALDEVGFSVDEIVRVLDKERRTELRGYEVLIGDLIDSPLDVDRMDYLIRDAHMTGLGFGNSNVEALIAHMRPFEDKKGDVCLTYDETALPHLENLLYARDVMYINCYEHRRKVCAERLLVRLAESLIAKGVKKETLMLLTDEQLLAVLRWVLSGDGDAANRLRSIQENRNFYEVGKYQLSKWDDVKNKPSFNSDLSGEVKAWYDNRPKKKQLKYTFLDTPKTWEDRICEEAQVPGLERWKVVVTVPAFDAKQERESAARVLLQSKNGYQTEDLFNVSPVMKAIVTNLIPAREVIRVLVSEELGDSLTDEVARASDRIFKHA